LASQSSSHLVLFIQVKGQNVSMALHSPYLDADPFQLRRHLARCMHKLLARLLLYWSEHQEMSSVPELAIELLDLSTQAILELVDLSLHTLSTGSTDLLC
jgi:hypothetical protein